MFLDAAKDTFLISAASKRNHFFLSFPKVPSPANVDDQHGSDLSALIFRTNIYELSIHRTREGPVVESTFLILIF